MHRLIAAMISGYTHDLSRLLISTITEITRLIHSSLEHYNMSSTQRSVTKGPKTWKKELQTSAFKQTKKEATRKSESRSCMEIMADCITHASYAKSHGSSRRPSQRKEGTRLRWGISFLTSWSEIPWLSSAQPIYLRCETKRTSGHQKLGEDSKLMRFPSKDEKRKHCIPNPIDDAKTGLTGSWVWTKNRTRADMPPAANDFWLPLFMYPIIPPATEFSSTTVSSHKYCKLPRTVMCNIVVLISVLSGTMQ
jgi:hypothetical protein